MLQSGVAVCADAVLIPEIPYDLLKVAAGLGGTYGLVEGATPKNGAGASDSNAAQVNKLMGSEKAYRLFPIRALVKALGVIERSGLVAESVALNLQRLTDHETFPLVLGRLVRGGAPTAVDRQLSLGLGTVRAPSVGWCDGCVPATGAEIRAAGGGDQQGQDRPGRQRIRKIARSLGICLGDNSNHGAVNEQSRSQGLGAEHSALLHG